jgi:hypothetical protein
MWRTQEGIRRYRKTIKAQTIKMRGRGFSWLSRLPVTQDAADSSLVAPASAHASLDCSTFRGPRGTCRAVALFDDKQATNKQTSKNRIFILPRAIC